MAIIVQMLSFRDRPKMQKPRAIGFRTHHRSLLTLQHRMPRTKNGIVSVITCIYVFFFLN